MVEEKLVDVETTIKEGYYIFKRIIKNYLIILLNFKIFAENMG